MANGVERINDRLAGPKIENADEHIVQCHPHLLYFRDPVANQL